MRVLKGLFFFIIGAVVLLSAIGAFLPSSVRVERSVLIDRPPSVVFALLNSYQRFNEWSPWYGLDPNAQYTYSGAASGVGAKMAWIGNDAVGSGSQTITASEPFTRVAADLDFGEMGVAKVDFKLVPEGPGTRVTWGFASDAGWNIVGRWFNLLMDKFIGADYEKGLSKLKTVAESVPQVDLSGADIAIVEVSASPEQNYAGRAIRVRHPGGQAGIAHAQSQGEAYIAVHALRVNGAVYTQQASDSATPTGEQITEVYLPIE